MAKKAPAISRHNVTAATEDLGSRLAGARLMPITLIRPNPWQPRQHANEERMQELIADIAARGVLEPLIVRPTSSEEGTYEIVAGERRYRASVAAKLVAVPVIVRDDLTEEQAREVSLVENLLREDLDIEDEARFIKALYDEKKSLRAVGEAIHKSYQYVNRRLKLLEDPGTLLAYREGLVRLDDLISDRSTVDDVTMPEASAVTERNNDDEGTEEAEKLNEGLDAQSLSKRFAGGELEEVRFFRTRSVFKPIHKLQLYVRRLKPATVEAEERAYLRRAIHDLISELTTFEQALEQATDEAQNGAEADDVVPNIELQEHDDGRPGWTVHRGGAE